jgi:UDP:flavonoid glycosyltransferase YjiC (YdhE family)
MMFGGAPGRERPADAPRTRAEMSPEMITKMAQLAFGTVESREFIEDLLPIIDKQRPELVVYEVANPGGAVAAAVAGIPVVSHGIGRFGGGEFRDALMSGLRQVTTDLGLDVDFETVFGPGQLYLDIYPPSLQDKDFLATEGRLSLRPVAFAEPGELPAVAHKTDRPLVYLTMGTAFGDADVLRAAISGLAALDVNVLVAAGPTVAVEWLGEFPANVTVESWIPQADLLPHTALVVHHGGSGTTLGTLAAGVPQLFLPQGADQFVNAEAVTAGGAGLRLLPGEVTADSVSEKAAALLADASVAGIARGVAQEIAAMPSPADVAARFAEFTG